MRYAAKTVIVTGGTYGIGEGCCRVFHSEGANVAIFARGAEAGEKLAAMLNSVRAGSARFYQCDVSDMEQLRGSVEAVAKDFGRIDCLINNAGSHPPATKIEDTTLEDMESLMRVNYLSTFAGCKFAVPHLRKTRGTIVNMSSIVALIGQPESTAYCATKGAQLGLTKSLAVELGADGIRVNAICPGNVDTPLMRSWAATLPDPKSALDRVAKLQVIGRMATPAEIGRIALFLATEDSSFLTGQAIEAEGGACLDY